MIKTHQILNKKEEKRAGSVDIRTGFFILVFLVSIVAQVAIPSTVFAATVSGTITSTNLLLNMSVSGVSNFDYSLSSLPVGSSATVQFSTDNTNWYSATHVLNASTGMTTIGSASIALSGFGTPTAFYYKMTLDSNSAGTLAPFIDSVSVVYVPITSAAFVVNDSGNVGIGIKAPTQKLDVAGSINISAGSAYKYNDANVITAQTTLSNYFFGGAGNSTMEGTYNTASGVAALASNTTGGSNTVYGAYSLYKSITGNSNVAVGKNAFFYNNSATSSVAVGAFTAVGTSAYHNQGGVYLGYNAGQLAATGSDYNTLLGYQSGYGVSTGARNVLIGNSTIGASFNQVTTGSNNIAIGNDVAVPSATASNQLNIGNLIYGTGLNGTGATVSTGNIGIGTTTPIQKLDINGKINLSGGVIQKGGTAITATSDLGLYSELAGHWMRFVTNKSDINFFSDGGVGTTPNMIIKSSGNVGIGTSAPSAKLQVAQSGTGVGTISTTAAGTTVTGAGTQFTNTFKVGDTITANGETHTISAIASDTSMTTDAWTAANTGVAYTLVGRPSLLSVLGNGNVGIGTTSPAAKLDVNGTTAYFGTGNTDTSFYLRGYNSATGEIKTNAGYSSLWNGIGIISNPTNSNSLPAWGLDLGGNKGVGSNIADAFAISRKPSAGSWSNFLTILSSGNVGIGTASPAYNLVVSGADAKIVVSGSNGAAFYMEKTGTLSGWSEWQQTGDRTRLNVNGAADIMTILNTGNNVGIGNANPATKLQVGGDIRVGTSGTNGCIENYAGTALTGTCSSDARLKTIKGNVTDILGKLSSLNLITYHWNNTAATVYHDATTTLNTGFVAQSVQKIFPGLITTDAKGYDRLDYTTLGLYGLEATKELNNGFTLHNLALGATSTVASWYTGTTTPAISVGALGNVGIGTTTPYSRLTVWGAGTSSTTSAFVIANAASTTEFQVKDNGNAFLAGSLSQNSDRRLKQNIKPLSATSSLATINGLTPVNFNWRNKSRPSTVQFGFIAQDVQQIFPSLVSTTSPTKLTPHGTLSVNYIGLISPMVSAIKDLSAQISSFAQHITTEVLTATTGRFTKKLTTKELCVGNTCINEAQLKEMLKNRSSSGVSYGASSSSSASNQNNKQNNSGQKGTKSKQKNNDASTTIDVSVGTSSTTEATSTDATSTTSVVKHKKSTPPPPSCMLTASPTKIISGKKATLSWTTKNSDTFVLDQGIGTSVPVASGSVLVAPTATTTFTGAVSYHGLATTTCAVSISVAPVSVIITANASSTAASAVSGNN